MKRDMLNIDERRQEEILELNREVQRKSMFYLLIIGIADWIVGYLILIGIIIAYHFFTGGVSYPNILLDGTIALLVIATVIIVSSALSGTKIVVPGALIVNNKALLDDINSARARAFSVGGPFVGYIVALFFYLMYELESV